MISRHVGIRFNFRKCITRSLEDDFETYVGISYDNHVDDALDFILSSSLTIDGMAMCPCKYIGPQQCRKE
ncbi:hypothetical protein BS78_01G299900 [Paspalum vaginatum]|nr:hypothetical protein BS78_01G299900 [Paspalum vaginatum]